MTGGRIHPHRSGGRWSAHLSALIAAVIVVVLPSIALGAPKEPKEPKETAAQAARGWTNPKALELAKEGIDAKKQGDLKECIVKDQASLALEDHPYVRLHISSCLAAVGRFKDALVNARDALAAALRNEDDDLKKAALQRVQELMPKLGRLKVEIPDKTDNLKITFNGIPLRPGQVNDKLTLDPGDYTIEALKEEKGDRYHFKATVTIAEGDDKTIEVLPKKDHLQDDVESCLREAKTYKERLKCIEEPSVRPNIHVGIDMGAYTDSVNVHVLTPGINAAIVSPTGGWNVGGGYILDMVTAASPDLVSTASRSYVEQRHDVSLNGGYKIGPNQLSANGHVSSEPDYLSRTLGVAASREMNEKLVTPRLAYSFTWDTIGYRNTPFAQFNRPLSTHALDGGITFVMSPTTLLVTGMSIIYTTGESAKLYRFVPMFPEDVATRVPAGASVQLVNEQRLSVRPRENVPDSIFRFAVGGRISRRFPQGTLRVEERIYTDNWGVKASSTDARYLHDLGERLRIGPHFRLHAQSGASFYQLAYAAKVDDKSTPIQVPQYRTGKRELSPMLGLTAGGTARIALTSEKATVQYAVSFSGDVMYDRYLASLFILSRTAVWGSVGLDAEF